MTTVSQIYPSPWLKVFGLQGRAVAVKIQKATVEQIRQYNGQKEARIVLDFAGKSKRLILNKTQAFAVATVAGTEDLDQWVGVDLVLKVATLKTGKPTIEVAVEDNPFKSGGGGLRE